MSDTKMQERLNALRDNFLNELPTRVDDAGQVFEKINADGPQDEFLRSLRDMFHRLKGVAKVFGYAELGEAAKAGETMVDNYIAQASEDTGAFVQELKTCIDRIKELADLARTNSDAPPQADEKVDSQPLLEQRCKKNDLKVVIVDDDDTMRNVLFTLLDSAGYDVIGQAKKGTNAIEICARTKADLVLLDINMPDLDGLQVLKAIRQEHPRTAVIMVSAESSLDNVCNALANGAKGFIVKPFNPEVVLDQVASFSKDFEEHVK